MHCNLSPPEPRQPLPALITTSCQVWSPWTYPLPYALEPAGACLVVTLAERMARPACQFVLLPYTREPYHLAQISSRSLSNISQPGCRRHTACRVDAYQMTVSPRPTPWLPALIQSHKRQECLNATQLRHKISTWATWVAASRVWNSLPHHVTSAQSLPVFCSRLKTHLFSRSFRWLYCCACEVTLVITDTVIAVLTLLCRQSERLRQALSEFSSQVTSFSRNLQGWEDIFVPKAKNLHGVSSLLPPQLQLWEVGHQPRTCSPGI